MLPRLIGAYATPHWAREIVVSGGHAVIANRSAGVQIVSLGMDRAVLDAATVVADPGNVIRLSVAWSSEMGHRVACKVTAGHCAVVESTRPMAVIEWTLPDSPGDFEIGASAGNFHAFVTGYAQIRVR